MSEETGKADGDREDNGGTFGRCASVRKAEGDEGEEGHQLGDENDVQESTLPHWNMHTWNGLGVGHPGEADLVPLEMDRHLPKKAGVRRLVPSADV